MMQPWLLASVKDVSYVWAWEYLKVMMARNYPSYAEGFWRMSCVLFAWQALDTLKVSRVAGQVSRGGCTALTSCAFDLLWILPVCADTSKSVSSNHRYLRLSHILKSVVCHVPIQATLQRSPFSGFLVWFGFFLFAESKSYLKTEWGLERKKPKNMNPF